MAEAVKRTSKTVFVRWIRSGIGFTHHQKAMVRSLGLRRLNQTVELEDTPAVRGLVRRIPHLVEIVPRPARPAWMLIPEATVHPPEAPHAGQPADGSTVAVSGASDEPQSAPAENSEGEE